MIAHACCSPHPIGMSGKSRMRSGSVIPITSASSSKGLSASVHQNTSRRDRIHSTTQDDRSHNRTHENQRPRHSGLGAPFDIIQCGGQFFWPEWHIEGGMAMRRRIRFCVVVGAVVLSLGVGVVPAMAQSGVYDLVADFGNLNIPAGASPSSITQTAGNVWTYQYENIAGNHDGTYTLMTNGWNANYRGYGLSSYVGGGGYPAGGNVRAVINPSENPAGVPVPDPADANYLQTRPSWAPARCGSPW